MGGHQKRSDDDESPTKKQKRFLSLPAFVEAEELAAQVLDNTTRAGQDYLIIDVRAADEREESGWIPGSVNIPSTLFEDNLDLIREKYHQVPYLYFHCALSQVRGPKCAQKYVTAINQSDAHHAEQTIFILRGGFDQWKGIYALDKRLSSNVSFGY